MTQKQGAVYQNIIELNESEKTLFKYLNKVADTLDIPKSEYCWIVTGGWIRDKLIGKKGNDFDILVVDKIYDIFLAKMKDTAWKYIWNDFKIISQQTIILKNQFCRSIKLNKIVIRIQNIIYELDIKLHKSNLPLLNDAQEFRDFTINSLFYNYKSDGILDYVNGFEDLKKKIIRTYQHPSIIFRDLNRIIRLFRLKHSLNFKIDHNIKDWLIKQNFYFLNKQKCFEHEFNKILSSKHYINIIKDLDKYKILKYYPLNTSLGVYYGRYTKSILYIMKYFDENIKNLISPNYQNNLNYIRRVKKVIFLYSFFSNGKIDISEIRLEDFCKKIEQKNSEIKELAEIVRNLIYVLKSYPCNSIEQIKSSLPLIDNIYYVIPIIDPNRGSGWKKGLLNLLNENLRDFIIKDRYPEPQTFLRPFEIVYERKNMIKEKEESRKKFKSEQECKLRVESERFLFKKNFPSKGSAEKSFAKRDHLNHPNNKNHSFDNQGQASASTIKNFDEDDNNRSDNIENSFKETKKYQKENSYKNIIEKILTKNSKSDISIKSDDVSSKPNFSLSDSIFDENGEDEIIYLNMPDKQEEKKDDKKIKGLFKNETKIKESEVEKKSKNLMLGKDENIISKTANKVNNGLKDSKTPIVIQNKNLVEKIEKKFKNVSPDSKSSISNKNENAIDKIEKKLTNISQDLQIKVRNNSSINDIKVRNLISALNKKYDKKMQDMQIKLEEEKDKSKKKIRSLEQFFTLGLMILTFMLYLSKTN